eukprot:GHVR01055806.1.p3 GENE.GHVR01055806.1~~GHVR01055806.1.p3  ORF type:complete len:109 (+),score=13.38 GHVR01055806.1:2071-2397(+)
MDDQEKQLDEVERSIQSVAGLQMKLAVKTKSKVQPGESKRYPAETCGLVKAVIPNAVSGYYWILPKCASEPVRAWCDMPSAADYVVWNAGRDFGASVKDKIGSVDDIR